MLNETTVRQIHDLGGRPLLDRLFETFLEHGPLRMESLSTAVEAADLEGAASASHSLRSSSVTLGADDLGDLATRIERHARAGELAAVEDLLPSVREELSLVTAHMRQRIAGEGS